jgi:hypothetical protein
VQFERYKDRRWPSSKENREPNSLLKSLLLDVRTFEAPNLTVFGRIVFPHLRADALAVFGSNSTPARPQAEYRISLCRINDSAERLTVGVAAVTLFGCCAIQM